MRRTAQLARLGGASAILGLSALALAACGGSDSSNATATTAAAATPTDTAPVENATTISGGGTGTLADYVAAVCKATVTLEAAVRGPGAPAGSATATGTDSGDSAGADATPDASGTPRAGRTPGGNFAGRAPGIEQAGQAFLAALQADNPPDSLKSFNDALVADVNTALTALQNATPPAGNADRTPNPDRTPGAGRPFANGAGRATDGTPGSDGTRPAGGRAGGAANLLLRNLPTPPADQADALAAAAAADTDCQSAGLTFTGG